MKEKLISIFTPIHRYDEKFLKDLYDSVMYQSYENFEWIILINTADTNVERLLREFFTDPKCKVYADNLASNIGYLKGKCCELCVGEVLVELDYDDMLSPHALREINSSFQDEDVQFAYSNCIEFTGNFSEGNSFTYSEYYGWKTRDVGDHKELIAFPPRPQYLRRIEWAPNHVRCFRKSSYEKIGGYNLSLVGGDDHDLICRFFIEYGEKGFHHMNKPLYYYRRHSSNTSGINPASKIELIQNQVDINYINHFEKMMQKWSKDNDYLCLDFGGRFNCPEGYTSVDLFDADIIMNLDKEWDLIEDNSVGIIRAYHILEHLKDPIHFFNQAYSKLVSGGVLLLEVPSTNRGGLGAFSDPTHKNFFNIRSIEYYTNQEISKYIQPQYTGRFQKSRVVEYMWNDGCCVLSAQLIALKGWYEDRWCGEKLMWPREVSKKKKRAVFTIVKNEKTFLPIWIDYYSKHFGIDIFILDNGTTDGSTKELRKKYTVLDTPSEFSFDHKWLCKTVNDFQKTLLNSYETVVFAEADELIIPRNCSLTEYLDNMKTSCVRATGYEIVHDYDSEDDYDETKSVFQQRKKWFRAPVYDKTLISSIPCEWSLGFHECKIKCDRDPDLLLVHLHRFDYKLHAQRKLSFLGYNMANEANSLGVQNKLKDENEIIRFFHDHPPLTDIDLKL